MTTLNGLPRSSTARDRESCVLLSDPRRANKGAYHLGILDARGALHTRGNIDAAGARDTGGLRDIFSREAARNHERQLEIELLEHMPVEHRTKAAGTGSALGRAGVEQNAIGHGGVAGQ